MKISGFGRNGQSGRMAFRLGLGAGCLLLAGCVHDNNVSSRTGSTQDVADNTPVNATPVNASAVKTVHRAPKPAAEAASASQQSIIFSKVGVASWYGADFHGRRTANGEIYNMHSLTAAHPTLPLSSRVRVTNLANHRSLVVRVNDRGPYVGRRVIDVSAKAAQLLGFYENGLAKVKVDYVGRARATAAGTPIAKSAAPL